MINIKQFVISTFFLFGFMAYTLNQKIIDTKIPYVRETNSDIVVTDIAQITTPNSSTTTEIVTKPVVKTTPKIPTQPVVIVPQGKYRNGTYTGIVADASYGLVQVEAVISGGKISDVVFLSYPNKKSESLHKSQRAMPILKQEAISVQSENVDAVSGASYTSAAFIESLGSALAQAKI